MWVGGFHVYNESAAQSALAVLYCTIKCTMLLYYLENFKWQIRSFCYSLLLYKGLIFFYSISKCVAICNYVLPIKCLTYIFGNVILNTIFSITIKRGTLIQFESTAWNTWCVDYLLKLVLAMLTPGTLTKLPHFRIGHSSDY